MASPAFKHSPSSDLTAVESAGPAFAGAPMGSSTVGDMQRELERRLTADTTEKWSSRRSLVFIGGACGLFWSAVAAIVIAIT